MRVKIRSTTPMRARCGRDEAAHLRHEDDQRHLTHIGGFTGHVGAGDDGDPVVLRAQMGVVGDEQACP